MKNRKKNKLLFPILLTVLSVIGLTLIVLTFKDSKEIKEQVYFENVEINNRLDSLTTKLDILTRDQISKEEIMYMRDEVYDFKLNVQKAQNTQSMAVQNLFLEHVKNWIWIIGLLAAVLVFTGLDWNISSFINSRLKEKVSASLNHIENVFNSEVWLDELRSTTQILVLNKEGTALDEGVETVLKLTKLDYNSKNLKTLDFNALQDNLEGITAVFIENANSGTIKTWTTSDVKASLKGFAESITNKGIAVFYYCTAEDFKDLVRFPTLDSRNYLTSFANTESNIYPNLKNLLVVQQLLVDENKLEINP
ncbi:hypothetical protein SAMN06298216_4433 [Spirosomataceae bacterium TFI 002]|nr:hypothetical protein SAMN06298216_4433 [Spirosomataceae bacterium TFI 002]